MSEFVIDENRLLNAKIRAYEAIDRKDPGECSVEVYKTVLAEHGFFIVREHPWDVGEYQYKLPRGMYAYQYEPWHGPVKKYEKS